MAEIFSDISERCSYYRSLYHEQQEQTNEAFAGQSASVDRKIAVMTGYTNNSFFHHLFQKHMGLSPGEYRKHPGKKHLKKASILPDYS